MMVGIRPRLQLSKTPYVVEMFFCFRHVNLSQSPVAKPGVGCLRRINQARLYPVRRDCLRGICSLLIKMNDFRPS